MGTAAQPTDLGLLSEYVKGYDNSTHASVATSGSFGSPSAVEYYDFDYAPGLQKVTIYLQFSGAQYSFQHGDEFKYGNISVVSNLAGPSPYEIGSGTGIFASTAAAYHDSYSQDFATYTITSSTGGRAEFSISGFDVYADGTYAQSAYNVIVVDTAENPPVCFASGTLIRTARGPAIVDVAVEDLAVGDLVVTASGEQRPIKWLGHRTMDCRNHPRPEEALPVRITAHAFGMNRPENDLFMSPGHAICVDVLGEVLVPASALINGSTIQQVEVDEVTYWHVELDSHDIILAEGLPAESYVDVGNRAFFVENDTVDLAAFPDGPVPSLADYCRPFHADGALVALVRKRLTARAEAMGWSRHDTTFAGLHLIVDGVHLQPTTKDLTARFVLPAEAKDVWLVSDTSVPALVADSHDRRALGICLRHLTIDDGLSSPRAIALDDPLLNVGFHGPEDEGAQRWTAGRARLPDDLWQGCEDMIFLRVDLARPSLPQWVAPLQRAASLALAS